MERKSIACWTSWIVVVALLPALATACSLSTSGLAGSGGSTTGPDGAASNGQFTVPDVFGMSKDAAIAELRKAGHTGDVSEDRSTCGSVVDGRIIEIGEVCNQSPGAGNVTSARLSITLRVQKADPRHGNVGTSTEWHLMPDIVGMPLEKARAVMRSFGFTEDDRILLGFVEEAGCAPLTVCRTIPAALSRSSLGSDKAVFVGADPDAKAPAASDSEAEPAEPEAGATKPAAEAAPESFF
jgi:hypothetical protein